MRGNLHSQISSFAVLFQFFKLILKHLLLTLQKMILFPSQIMIKITFISHWKCIYSLTVYAWCICTFREPITFLWVKLKPCNNDKTLEISINIYQLTESITVVTLNSSVITRLGQLIIGRCEMYWNAISQKHLLLDQSS